MFQGKLISIHLTPAAGQPMLSIDKAHIVPGQGMEGDRYFSRTGTYSDKSGPDRELTLIEIEAIEALTQEEGIELIVGETRRNLITRGVPLNHLVGQEFMVGEVRLKGIRLCEPCNHLAKLTQKPGLLPGLIHRGGLRAQVLSEGTIYLGDNITVAS